jgi:hypothetical protein
MSIRLIAKDLYRLQQEVARLERELASAPAEGREDVAKRVRQARAERDRLRAALDGRKDAAR